MIDHQGYRDAFVDINASELEKGPITVTNWQSLRITYSEIQNPKQITFKAKAGGELWVELNGNGIVYPTRKRLLPKRPDLLMDFDFQPPKELSGFSEMILRPGIFCPDLKLLEVEFWDGAKKLENPN